MAMMNNNPSFVFLVALVLVSAASVGHAEEIEFNFGFEVQGEVGTNIGGGTVGVNVTVSCGQGERLAWSESTIWLCSRPIMEHH